MDGDMRNLSEQKKNEMYRMQSRAMPPMPSFVRPVSENRSRNNTPAQEENRTTEADSEPIFKDNAGLPKPKKSSLFPDFLKLLDTKGLGLDSDRILILLLAALLSGEGSDEILLFALAYIML